MNLSNRDLNILEYIKDQGYVTNSMLKETFFSSDRDYRRRIGQLQKAGFIDRKLLKTYFESSSEKYFFPHLLPLGVNLNTQIVSLSGRMRRLYPDYNLVFKKDILLHQLYLGKVRNHFANVVQHDFIFSEYEIKTFSNLVVDRNKEINPDLSFESKTMRLAVEMERTKKTFDRYYSKFYNFYDSSYTHVLYIFIDHKSLNSVMGLTKIYRKIGYMLYQNLDEVYSPVYGKLKFNEWFEKIKSVSGGEK